jgi:hypothetical protein
VETEGVVAVKQMGEAWCFSTNLWADWCEARGVKRSHERVECRAVTVGKTYIGLVVGVLTEVEVSVAGNKAVSAGNKAKTRQLCVSGENVPDCSEELSVRMMHNQAKNVLEMAVRIVTMIAGVVAGRSRTGANIEVGAPSGNFGRLVVVAGVVAAVVVAVVAVVAAVHSGACIDGLARVHLWTAAG